jgi:hypothetical protein
LHARTSDPSTAFVEAQAEAPPAAPVPVAEPVAAARAAARGPAFIEVARDGRLYRIPLRRQAGNLEAERRADEARRPEQQAALARDRERQARAPVTPAEAGAPARSAPSVVEFTLRYEVAK